MRSWIFTVISAAALLSVSSGVFAQGAEPAQGAPPPVGSPGAVPSFESEPPLSEPRRYHPCPASVEFSNGRNVCLGLEPGPPRTYGCGRWCRW